MKKPTSDRKDAKKLSNAKWDVLRNEMRQVMVETAKRGQLITYSELCATLKTAYLHYHSPLLVKLLIEIGRAEAAEGRPVLPAVVVGKQSGMPGAGYFKIGVDSDGEAAFDDPELMWRTDLEAVFQYWSEHE